MTNVVGAITQLFGDFTKCPTSLTFLEICSFFFFLWDLDESGHYKAIKACLLTLAQANRLL